ncbi:MAG: fructosamine kinase family protein [Ekhidna sp.]|uniref:fructosamine kinase family protein n=1 Tax=Ekhidna sp. TaxID=2608089 RepID=UPI0032EDD15A
MNSFFKHIIETNVSNKAAILNVHAVSGGCINSTFRIETSSGSFFLKYNQAHHHEMFVAEEKGLGHLSRHSTIRIPKVLGRGSFDSKAYLLLEWIDKGAQSAYFWEHFAQNLARQHQASQSYFGLDHDNFIGSLPQSNKPHKSWSEFFILERLAPQIKLAKDSNLIDSYAISQFETLFSKLDHLVPEEPPALLHGDLWSGNFMCGEDGAAVIYDPAIYYGHRETELAFTKLFGGFSSEFYQHYHESYPLEPGFDERIDIHNLYPLLVHVNLFGPSYLSGIRQTLKRLT